MFGKKQAPKSRFDHFLRILSGVDKTYSNLPMRMQLDIERISRGMNEFGPRKLPRPGPGMEFYESRDFRPDSDEPRMINARLSGRLGRPVIIEREAEVRQHFYLWRDSSESMNYKSKADLYTKKQAAEVMLLAFAKHLARNEEVVGIIDRKGVYRGSRAVETLAGQLLDVTIVAGDMPSIGRPLPIYSTAVLFGDFLMDPKDLGKQLGKITGMGLNGYVVMVLDPQEVDFAFRGHVEFNGMEGEGRKAFQKAESMRAAYHDKMKTQIKDVERVCRAKGFQFFVQRTDTPLHDALLAIYGVAGRGGKGPAAPGL